MPGGRRCTRESMATVRLWNSPRWQNIVFWGLPRQLSASTASLSWLPSTMSSSSSLRRVWVLWLHGLGTRVVLADNIRACRV